MSGSDDKPRVVRLKGVPPKATSNDVCQFFSGLSTEENGIRMLFKERRTTGEAFVVFTSSNDALEACKMDKEFFAPEKFDQRYVRVLLAPDLSPESVISGAVIDQQQHTVSTAHQGSHRSNSTSFEQSGLETAIKVSGLPSGMSKAEILQLFWGLQTTPSAMHIQRPASEECNTCDAFIDFGADYIAMQAISSWNGTVITTQDGAFTVTVEKASQLDWNAAHRKSSNGWQTMQSESLVRMRGLPSDVTVTDVQAFFKGFAIKPSGIYIPENQNGQVSKPIYIDFLSNEEAARAIRTKDRQHFNNQQNGQCCSLQSAHRSELESSKSSKGAVSSGLAGGSTMTTAFNPLAAPFSAPPPPITLGAFPGMNGWPPPGMFPPPGMHMMGYAPMMQPTAAMYLQQQQQQGWPMMPPGTAPGGCPPAYPEVPMPMDGFGNSVAAKYFSMAPMYGGGYFAPPPPPPPGFAFGEQQPQFAYMPQPAVNGNGNGSSGHSGQTNVDTPVEGDERNNNGVYVNGFGVLEGHQHGVHHKRRSEDVGLDNGDARKHIKQAR